MLPNKRRERSEIEGCHPLGPFRSSKDALHHERVDIDHAVLEQVQTERTDLVVFAPIACELTALGEKVAVSPLFMSASRMLVRKMTFSPTA